jgi:putative nucleotidyltransferase with HDIG domain
MTMADATPESKRSTADKIVSHLVEQGHEALFAGGCVRDMLLGKGDDKSDIDIVTNATPKRVAELFPRTIGVGAQFGVVIVVQNEIPFEVATFRSDLGIGDGRHPEKVVFSDARQDALRRDFTINGMFYDPRSDTLLDYVSGRADLQAKVIRAIGDPVLRFKEDYLRLLRAIRFAARFEFTIEESTWQAIRENAAHITEISAERIFAELTKMLQQPHPDRAVTLLAESGLLQRVLPEVADCIGVEQPPEFHPEGDVFTHTVKLLGFLGPNPSAVLAWSALLHDIGKKPTMRLTDRIRFNGHDQVGAAMARELLRRLKASNELIDSAEACIDNHMNFINVKVMRLATLKKFLSRPTIEDELTLHRADCLASHGNLDNFSFVKNALQEFARERLKPAPFLRGEDLIDLGLKPGPLFGKILQEAYDLQLDEKLSSRVEALEHIKRGWGEKGTGTALDGSPQ